VPVDDNDPRPAYLQIADEMRKAITSGELAPGRRLASGRELAREYGVAPMTIQQALRELRDEGLVVAWQGRGVFVRDDAGEPTDAANAVSITRIIDQLESVRDGLHELEDRVAALEAESKPRPSRAPRRDG
jgi:DNA-binding GntR family transcriptional regulator